MHSLQDLQTREISVRTALAQTRLESAAASLQWPRKIDPNVNGKADDVRREVDAYLRKLLSLPAEFPDAVRYREKEEALKRTDMKIRKAHAHRPLPPEKMRRHHIEIPEDYDYSEALFHWANDVIGPLHDKRDAREKALEEARPAYDAVKPDIERCIQELRDDVVRINALLDGIAARRPSPPPRAQPTRAQRVQAVPVETKQSKARPEHPEKGLRVYTFPVREERLVPFRHDRIPFVLAPEPEEPSRTGVEPVDPHVILVGTFPG